MFMRIENIYTKMRTLMFIEALLIIDQKKWKQHKLVYQLMCDVC